MKWVEIRVGFEVPDDFKWEGDSLIHKYIDNLMDGVMLCDAEDECTIQHTASGTIYDSIEATLENQ